MIDFKKMDDKDFVFVSKPLSEKDEKEFSDFLKSRKSKGRLTRTKKSKSSSQRKAQTANKEISQ